MKILIGVVHMYLRLFKLISLILLTIIMASCNFNIEDKDMNENLINKVNAIDNQWVNHDGLIEQDNTMVQSQFIPYNADVEYLLNNDAYVSYYNGEEFIKTELYEDKNTELNTVAEADGVILSFNKENKNGIKLVMND